MENNNAFIDLNSFINSISLSLDLAEACALRDKNKKLDFDVSVPGFDVHSHNFANHSKRTALVALSIAYTLNYDATRLKNLYIAACSHDIGAVEAFTESHRENSFIHEHSEFGSDIIKKLPVDNSISGFIRFHHENWDGSGPNGLVGSSIPEEAQIIHIADMFELIYSSEKPYWVQRDHIVAWIKSKQEKLFSRHIVAAFMEACMHERFWLDIENINSNSDILTRMHPPVQAPMSLNVMKNIAVVYAAIIDKKSTFTHEHSIGLSNHASLLSKYYGFDEDTITKMKIASLLHDIGKLSVPNHILDKPGKLTSEEYTIIKAHTYYTELILGKIKGMEDISQWAANHHETLKGTGYPNGLGAEQLSLESRIISVCDIYQALTEARPYRSSMSKDKALEIIDSMAEAGNIDCSVVEALKHII